MEVRLPKSSRILSEREAQEQDALFRRGGRSAQFEDGRRTAIKACVAWLHAEADAMNDAHAKAILNTAALGMGVHFKRSTTPSKGE